ncbi:unnamed protein product [Withania somnifera]
MAIDAGSGSKNKDNDSNNSKNKLVRKGSSSYDSGKTDRFTRSSVKETSSKQMDLSAANKRKSERLEKQNPPMPPAKKKSAELEQQNTPSPLRRSVRCSTLSRSKYLGRESNSSSIKEEKREKIVKTLTMESESVSTSKQNATTPVDLKRKEMDSSTHKLLFKKQKKVDTASDACEDDGTDGKHGSKSQSSLLHETDQVEPEERRMLYNEQKSLHIHLKAEIAKLFGVIKVSEVIKQTSEKFLEYIMENHRVSREPETILQAFQISLSWTAASILKEKIDKDYIFLLVKQQLQFRCTKEEANNVYLKLRSLKKMFLRRLDQNSNALSSSRYSISPVKSVGEEPNKESISQAGISAQLKVKTDIIDRLHDNELSGEGTVTPTGKDSQREKVIKEVQCGHGKRISMLEQEEQKKIEEFHGIWENKKKSVLRAVHGETAATKDRQKLLETKFAKKIEVHTCLRDQQLKELEAKYFAMRNEEMQKVSSQRTRETSSGRGHYSGDEIGCSQGNLDASDSIPKTAVSGLQGDMAVSDAPVSSPGACHVLPIQSTNIVAASVSEELAEITFTGRASVAAVMKSNEAGNSGDTEEEFACKVPLSPKEHTGEVAWDKQSKDCLEISEVALNEADGYDKISDVNNTTQELVTKDNMLESNSSLPNVVGNQRDEVSCIDGNQTTPEELPTVPSSDDASSLPQNPVNLDECSQSSGDNGTHNDMQLGEKQIGMQTELVSGHTINNTSEAILAANSVQHHGVDDGVPIAAHHTHREFATLAPDERNTIPIPGSSPHVAEPSHQTVSPAVENLEPCASVLSDIRFTHNQSILPAVSRVHPQSTANLSVYSQNTEAVFQLVHSSAELPRLAVPPPNTNVAFVQGSSDMPVRPVQQMATCNLAHPFLADPLHIEWERIHKEKEQVTKGLEDMHLHQVLQQKSLRSSPFNGSCSAHQSVEAPQTSISSSPVANCSVYSAETPLPPSRSSSVAGSSSSSQPAAISRSTTFSAGNLSRPPPLISSITPSRGNHRLGGDVRAPAPHLQRFKGPTPTPVCSSSTFLNGMTGHPRPVYVAASLQPTLQNQIQLPLVQQLPVNRSDSGNASLDHGLGGLPAIQKPSLSARELLQEMENRSRANRPNSMLPLPDFGCNFDSLDLSDFHSLGSVKGGSISSETATNVSGVVCLSDDD